MYYTGSRDLQGAYCQTEVFSMKLNVWHAKVPSIDTFQPYFVWNFLLIVSEHLGVPIDGLPTGDAAAMIA